MEQQQFQPLWTKEQLKQFTTMYEGRGHLLSPEHKQKIEEHSSYYNVPFYEGEGDTMGIIKSIGQGILEGFSANIYRAKEAPTSQAEAMAKNIGHLIGFAPGILSKPTRMLFKGSAGRRASRMAEWANQYSVPMATANLATKHAKKAAKGALEIVGLKNVDTLGTVGNFLAGGAARNITKQAFHLGIASGVGAWRDGVDGVMGAFVGGATAGAVFGGIGEKLGKGTFLDWNKLLKNPKTAESANTAIKAAAGAIYQGGSATAHGASSPEQVYEYLLGAYFGGGAVNWRRAKAVEFVQKVQKKGAKGSKEEREVHAKWADEEGAALEKHPDFYENPIEVQKELRAGQEEFFGIPEDNVNRAAIAKIAEELKFKIDKDDYTLTEEGFRDKGEYIDGEAVVDIKESQLKEHGYSGTTGSRTDAGLASITGEYGIPSINFVPYRSSKDKIVGLDRKLDEVQRAEAIPHMEKAASTLTSPVVIEGKTEWVPRDITKLNSYERDAISKNYWAVKNAKSVYLIAPIEHAAGRNVKGRGVEWAAEFAKNLNKELYVFDYATPGKEGWHRWGGKRFERMTGKNHLPPKPPANIAVIGAEGADQVPHVHGALRQFLGKHLKKKPIVNEVKKRARALVKSQQKEVEKLLEGKANLEKTIKDYEGKEQTDEVIRELEVTRGTLDNVESQLQALRDKITLKTIETDTREDIKETVESVDAMEDLEGAMARKTGKKSLQFVTDFMKDFWGAKAGHFTPFTQREQRIEMSEAVSLIIKEIGEKGSTNNRSEEAVTVINDMLNSLYGAKEGYLNDVAKSELRQWVTRFNLGKPVTHLQSDGVTFNRMPNDDAPISKSGNRKLQEEPETVLETVYKELGVVSNNPDVMTLDHVTIKDKVTGKNMDLDISRFRDKHPAEYEVFIKNIHNKADKEGYYVFGGVSDRDKLYFSKYHPEAQTTDIKLSHVMKQFVMKDKKRERLVTAEQLRLSRAEAAKQGINQAHHDKIFMSNMLYDLSFNGMPANKKSLGIILNPKNDFITGSAKFNKRMQIWFTPAWKGDKEFIKENYVDGNGKSLLNDKDGYNVIFVNDGDAIIKEATLKSLENIKNPEHMDGGIIIEDRLLDTMNRDYGVPESGQNKSFIVSRHPELGAMLGKFMFHGAGEKVSAAMRRQGVHMIIPDSASKQRGAREQGRYELGNIGKDSYGILGNSKAYNIDPTDVRGSFSVFGSDHFFERQRLPKQVMMNMLQTAFEPMDQKVIDKAFEDIIGERWAGKDKYNDLVVDYLDKAVEGKQNEANVEHIIENIESIGMRDILRAMKSENAPELSEAIYQKMLKVTRETLQADLESGDITRSEFKEYAAEVSEFNSITDRVVKLATEISKEAADNGFDITADSIYNHKFVRDFRMKAVQNFLVNSATKPKLANSGAAFMRPYDLALQMNLDKANALLKKNNLEGINHKDEIFMLDEGHRVIPINFNSPSGKPMTKPLGWVFDTFQKEPAGQYKDYLDGVLTSATVRVPMDSVSGMQVLKFKGFTGRKGHGILLHSRTMRLEGGADLDGDKSFFFFGGNGGMSPEMMNQFYKNRKEFLHKDAKGNTHLKDNKKSKLKKKIGESKIGSFISDLLVTESSGSSAVDLANTNISHYAPAERMRITAAAVDGRNQLGPAVSNAQLMRAAYNSIVHSGGEDKLFFSMNVAGKKEKANWVKFEVKIKAKQGKDDVEYQRDMSRAQLGLASDPMDVLGLKGLDVWKKLLWDAYFEATSVREAGQKKGTKSKYTDKVIEHLKDAEKLKFDYTNSGVYGHMANLNKALWGRNYAESRNFDMDEISALTESAVAINNIPGASNSFLPKIGHLFNGVEWSDSPFARLNIDTVKHMYMQAEKALSSNKDLQGLLERSTMKTPENAYVDNVMKMRLWDPVVRDNVSKSLSGFLKAIKGTNYEKIMNFDKAAEDKIKATNGHHERLRILRKLSKQADDFIVNDVSDIITINLLKDIMSKGQITPERFKLISRKVEALKKNSYLMSRARTRLEGSIRNLSKENEAIIKEARKFFGKEIDEVQGKDDFKTAELDQSQIDNKIKQFRSEEKLTKIENQLFDQLMLGSINRGKFQEKIAKFEKTSKIKDKMSMDFIKHLRDLNSRTAVSRLGFSSLAIDDASVSLHLKRYMELMANNHRPLNQEQLKELGEVMDTQVNITPDTPVTLDKIARHSGWGAVQEGSKLRSEAMGSVVTEIVSLLKDHPEIVSDKSGHELNKLMRGLPFIQKDVEAMNNNDFKMVRNWLRQVKKGTIWQRVQRLFKGEEAGKSLAWRSHMQLMPTINRELMATDIQLMQKEGFFTDKRGKIQRGDIAVPTQFMDRLSNSVSTMMEAGVEAGDAEVTKFQESQLFYQGLEEAPLLWEVAVREREWGGRHEYKANATKHNKNPEEVSKNIDYLKNQWIESRNKANWPDMRKREFHVNKGGKRVLMTGDAIVKKINKDLTVFMKDMHQMITGKEGALDAYRIGYYDKLTKESPRYDHEVFLKDLDTYLNGKVPKNWKKFMKSTNESVPSIFGIDGVRAMMREMYIAYNLEIGRKKGQSKDKDLAEEGRNMVRVAAKMAEHPIKKTGQLNFDTYFPRMFYDPAIIKKTLKTAQERIANDPATSVQSKAEELAKLQFKLRRLDGDYHFDDMQDTEVYDIVMQKLADRENITDQQMDRWFDIDVSMGNMRTRENSTPGWNAGPTSVEAYARSLSNTYFKGLAGMLTRDIVSNPKTGIYEKLVKKWGPAQAEAWTNFAKLYSNDALGNPVTVTKKMLANPDMKLKYSPYSWWADNKMSDRVNIVARKLGLGIILPKGSTEVTVDKGAVKFISGMQDGADVMGVEWARKNGYKVGGTAPTGFAAESGNKPQYSSLYNAREVDSFTTSNYKGREKKFGPRTEKNVKDADLTIVFGNPNSPGSQLTMKLAHKHKKAILVNPSAADIKAVMKANKKFQTINIAGNRPAKLATYYPKGIESILNEGFGKRKSETKTEKHPERYIGAVDMHTMRRWSQMEAKYEMATLLAHPKSAMANIMGGTLHTLQSVGLSTFKKVYNYEYLQQIDPTLKNRKDVDDMVIKHGVLPQWLIYELGLQKEFQSNQGKEALKVISDAVKRNPTIEEGELRSLFKRKAGNISESIVNKAAKFMTIPERRLRTDAFMAHYIQAWEKFGGAIQDPHHPFLIEMGKKGVKATQFMYSAPFRPGFARTAFGKIFTRFQMYAWNSLALRGDVMRRLEVAGYDPNSPEGKEAGRFLMGDMFMLSLANMFAYSLFESNLPQPYGWYQDTADWIFGNEEERDRAFFGAYPSAIAPLQVVSPPLLRLAGPILKGFLEDDYSRIASYYMHTMMPFGRLGRDIYGQGGVLDSPMRTIDKMIGIPMMQIQREATHIRKAKEKGEKSALYPRGILGGYE